MEENNKNKINHDVLKWIGIGVILFALAVFIFGAGMWIGMEKARFSYRWAENYHMNFGGPSGGFMGNMPNFPGGDFINGHGIFGQIIKIENNSLVTKGNSDAEKVINVLPDTVIERMRDRINIGDLKVNDSIVVIGSPDASGNINAKLIRVMPNINNQIQQ